MSVAEITDRNQKRVGSIEKLNESYLIMWRKEIEGIAGRSYSVDRPKYDSFEAACQAVTKAASEANDSYTIASN